MLNQCIFVGRLAADPESNITQSGLCITTFRLAVERDQKEKNGEKGVDYISCKSMGKPAKTIAEYCKKGRMLSVVTRYQKNRSEKDGNVRYFEEFIVNSFNFLGPSGNGSQGSHEDHGCHDHGLPF
jgi:single-strand DNA-binding protein